MPRADAGVFQKQKAKVARQKEKGKEKKALNLRKSILTEMVFAF